MAERNPIILFNQLNNSLSSYSNEFAVTSHVSKLLKNKLELRNEPVFEGFREVNCSYLLRFSLNQETMDFPKNIYVKLFKKKVANVNVPYAPFENSYRSMKQLCNLSIEIPSLLVQKPLTTLPEVNALVMEWVDGTSLTELMQYSNRFSSKKEKRVLEKNFEHLGKTIGLIHKQSLGLAGFPANSYTNLESNLQHLQNLLGHSYLKNSKCARQALTYLNNAHLENNATTWIHGDLSPTNVLLTRDNKMALIDFEHSRFDSPYFDIGSFTVRASIYLGHNPVRFSHGYNNLLIDKFLAGYFSSSNQQFSREMLRYYQTFDLLQFILNHIWRPNDYFYNQNIFAMLLLKAISRPHIGVPFVP